MSKEIFLSQTFGLEDKAEDGKLTGRFEGVANSGQPVKDHWGIQNLITDIESLTFKDQIPIFLNHWPENIVGYASLKIGEDKQLYVEGKISKATEHGRSVLDLAEDGFKWELSIGVSGNYEDVREAAVEVNGYTSPVPSTIIRQGRVFEVSFCPIGADDQTFVNVFKKPNKNKGDNKMEIKFSAEDWKKFACGCGGTGEEETLAELEEVMVDSEDLKALEDENASLKAEIEALKQELASLKEEEVIEQIASMAKAKGIELSEEKLKELASDKDKATMFLDMASAMKDVQVKPVVEQKKKIDDKFTKTVTVKTETVVETNDKLSNATSKAKKLAAEKGISFSEAIALLPDEDFK